MESRKLQSLQTENELLSQSINSLTREKNDLRTTILELESKLYYQNNEIERLKRSNEELGVKLVELGVLNEAQHELLIKKEQEMMIVIHEKEVEVIEVRQRLMNMETSKKEEVIFTYCFSFYLINLVKFALKLKYFQKSQLFKLLAFFYI